jgi:erythrin-vacuolar iron transport family protein
MPTLPKGSEKAFLPLAQFSTPCEKRKRLTGNACSRSIAEALSDDGSLTGRGHPLVRGLVCGAMTTLGGIGHTLPFLISGFRAAFFVAFCVVLAELAVITWIRHRYMETPAVTAAVQVSVGGALVFATGVLIGNS